MNNSTTPSMKVVNAPDLRLRIKTKSVKKINQGLIQTLKDMVKLTKTFKDPEGVGLASTQVGLRESFFVAKFATKKGRKFASIINPKILSTSKKTKKYFEGCLSIPNIWGEVKRATQIKVSYQNSDGRQVTETLKGVQAWIFQHEVDHLNGILFSDRCLEQKGKFYRFTGKDEIGTETFQEITI
ncbi:peptide deformylase [Patescibacteria group bacterium]|nr:peptide deformylase [Patescibacteria group bacterium]